MKRLDATDFVGKKFGTLTITEAERRNYSNGMSPIQLKATCECGRIRSLRVSQLKPQMNCGALHHIPHPANGAYNKENCGIGNIWKNMIKRCTDKNTPSFHNYGGRGISVSAEWLNFDNFKRDMWPRPSKKHSIDRIDNNKGYSRDNCRWATQIEQCQNTRKTIFADTEQGKVPAARLYHESGVSHQLFHFRLMRGWSAFDAATRPAGEIPDYIKAKRMKMGRKRDVSKYVINWNGEQVHASIVCRMHGVPYSRFVSRMKIGIDPIVAATSAKMKTGPKGPRKRKPIDESIQRPAKAAQTDSLPTQSVG
jgi:hypothetical protein